LTFQPCEKNLLADIEKAILIANLGFNPMNNGESVIINIPPLTEERRRDLAKLAKAESENAKIVIRAARKDANDEIKKSGASDDVQKNYEIDIQSLTDEFIKKVDEIFSLKEKEILTV
jgi:ribosome recycling factor